MIKKLSNKEIKLLKKEIFENFGEDLSEFLKKNNDLWLYMNKEKLILLNKSDVLFFYYNNKIIPSIKLFVKLGYVFLKDIKIDKGAEKYILNGADIFRPGVVYFDKNIKKEYIIVVFSEDEKLLSVAEALVDYDEFEKMEKGKVAKNIHFFNDKIFNFKFYKKD